MKHQLLTATSDMLSSCLEIFRKKYTDTFSSTWLKTSITRLGSINDMMNSRSRKHADRFKMSQPEHYYIGLTVHYLNGLIWNWMGNTNDYKTLFSRYVYEPFKTFQPILTIENIYKNDLPHSITISKSRIFVSIFVKRTLITLEYLNMNTESVLSRKSIMFGAKLEGSY